MPSSGKPKLDWAGAKDLNKIVMIGTPHSRSTLSLAQLIDGIAFGTPSPSNPPSHPPDQLTFLFESHLGITPSRTFTHNILFELLEKN